jgi:hypothetical protein
LVDKLGTADAVALLDFQRGSTAAPTTVSEWLHTYVDHRTGRAAHQTQVPRLHRHRPSMGHLAPQAVTQFTDAAWVLYLEERGNSG